MQVQMAGQQIHLSGSQMAWELSGQLLWLLHQSLDKTISEWVMWGFWLSFWTPMCLVVWPVVWLRLITDSWGQIATPCFNFPPSNSYNKPIRSIVSPSVVWSAHYSVACSYSTLYLLVPQASGQVGHFSQVSPKAPGSVHWQRPHTQLPRPLHICPSSEMQDAVSVEQLQLSPM